MSLNYEEIKAIALSAVERYEGIIEKYQERKWQAYAECNQNIRPNIDNLGRLHAPTDGYEYSDGSVYNKGEYLPDPEDEMKEFFGSQINRTGKVSRLLILEDQKEIFDRLNGKDIDNLKVEFSKSSWYNQDMDARCTYAYLSGPASTFLFNEVVNGQNEYLKNKKEEFKDSLVAIENNEAALIKGEIVKIRIVEDTFASTHYNTVFKKECGIKLETGNIIFGTLSKKISDIVPPGEEFEKHLVGKKIEMIAKLSPKNSDPTTGYYKSPKQIKLFDEKGVEIKIKKERKLKNNIS